MEKTIEVVEKLDKKVKTLDTYLMKQMSNIHSAFEIKHDLEKVMFDLENEIVKIDFKLFYLEFRKKFLLTEKELNDAVDDSHRHFLDGATGSLYLTIYDKLTNSSLSDHLIVYDVLGNKTSKSYARLSHQCKDDIDVYYDIRISKMIAEFYK